MKKIIISLLLFASSLWAQLPNAPFSGTVTGSGCITVPVGNRGSVVFEVSGGTWTGTIQPQAVIDSGTAFNIQVTPLLSTTAQNTVTANGIYSTTVVGFDSFKLCGNTVTNTATVKGNAAQLSAKNIGTGSPPGGGTVTSVSGTTNQIDVATGTTTPVLSLSSSLVLPGTLAQSYTDTTTTLFSLDSITLAVNPATTKTGGSNALLITRADAPTQNVSGRMRGLFINMAPTGSAALSRLEGLLIQSQSSATGIAANYGAYLAVSSFATSGTLTDNAAIKIITGAGAAGGTVTRDFGVTVDPPLTTGTMTHHYGLFFSNGQSDNSTTRNPDGWALYVAGALDKSLIGLYYTNQNCSAVGSAANPSIVACAAAPAGAFSCATNASAGTCTVNTAAAHTNSNIRITSTAAASTRLGVTCNTTLTATTAPTVAAISDGVSFTINVPTITTNPACFYFWIDN